MQKHAYLIIAHNNFYILEKLLKLLDYEHNDIFLHIDKKCKNFDFKHYKNICKKSNIIFTEQRINVKWGDKTQIETELLLFETAYNHHKYHYYHLISGVDLPLKSQYYIHNFFKNKNHEFITFQEKCNNENLNRITFYHLIHSKNNTINKLDNLLIKFQKLLKINRLKHNQLVIKKGANWCSITQEAVKILLEHKKEIQKLTNFSHCADEIYKQTILFNNMKNNTFINDNKRYIEWENIYSKSPKTFDITDYDKLISSDKLFARKFDINKDKNIIDKIYNYINNEQNK